MSCHVCIAAYLLFGVPVVLSWIGYTPTPTWHLLCRRAACKGRLPLKIDLTITPDYVRCYIGIEMCLTFFFA